MRYYQRELFSINPIKRIDVCINLFSYKETQFRSIYMNLILQELTHLILIH